MRRNIRKSKPIFSLGCRIGMSLVEVLIVVAILGILAAIAVPEFRGHTQRAKEATAKDNLRILRNAIERYANQHNSIPPGYRDNDPTKVPVVLVFGNQLTVHEHYLTELPENPFNGLLMLKMIDNDTPMPTEPVNTGIYGWIYKASTKEIRLNWPGIDSQGINYFDY